MPKRQGMTTVPQKICFDSRKRGLIIDLEMGKWFFYFNAKTSHLIMKKEPYIGKALKSVIYVALLFLTRNHAA